MAFFMFQNLVSCIVEKQMFYSSVNVEIPWHLQEDSYFKHVVHVQTGALCSCVLPLAFMGAVAGNSMLRGYQCELWASHTTSSRESLVGWCNTEAAGSPSSADCSGRAGTGHLMWLRRCWSLGHLGEAHLKEECIVEQKDRPKHIKLLVFDAFTYKSSPSPWFNLTRSPPAASLHKIVSGTPWIPWSSSRQELSGKTL